MTARPIDIKRARQGLARLDALLAAHPELREPDAQARLTAWLEEEQRRAMERYSSKRKAIRGTGDPKTRERVQRMRERRKQTGWTQHELWIDPPTGALIVQLMQPDESVTDVVRRAVHTLAQHQTQERPQPIEAPGIITSNATSNGIIDHMDPRHRKAALVTRLREMKAQGLSLDKIAAELNREAVPTLSGKGSWKKGTIGKLLAEVQDLGAYGP